MDPKPEYDSIGKQYNQATLRPLRRYAYEPTIRAYLPDLHGKRVLDLACGDGVVTRMMRDAGARELVGLDISEPQIALAQAQDCAKITYAPRNCMRDDLTEFGKFDLVTGMMFLQEAKDHSELEQTAHNVNAALVPGGRFLGMVVDPELVYRGNASYGIDIPPGHKEEGQEVVIALSDFNGNKFCDVRDRYWSRKSFEAVFKRQGLATDWLPGIVSDEGIAECSRSFWKEFQEHPLYVMLRARKPGHSLNKGSV